MMIKVEGFKYKKFAKKLLLGYQFIHTLLKKFACK